MTRKDYQLIAEKIAYVMENCISAEQQLALNYLVNELSTALKAENPRFDALRFANACAVTNAEYFRRLEKMGN